MLVNLENLKMPSLSKPVLVGVVVESVLYGLYLVFFIGSLYITHIKQLKGGLGRIDVFLSVVVVILFLLITAHWVTQVLRTIDAFIYMVDGNPDVYYLSTNTKAVVKGAFLICQIIVADSTMVYRFYIVWGKSWRMVLIPLALTIGLVGSGFGFIGLLSTRSPTFSLEQYSSWVVGSTLITVFFGVTLILNIAISGLISYHIWSINHRVAKFTGQYNKINSVVHILLEGAVLYVGCLCSAAVGLCVGATYEFIPLDATSPMIGITFCLIIVWVGLGKGVESTRQVLSDLQFRHQSRIEEQDVPPQ